MRHVELTISPGLPDCIFSYRKSQFGEILEGLAMEYVVISFAIWYTYCVVIRYIFPQIGILHLKIRQPRYKYESFLTHTYNFVITLAPFSWGRCYDHNFLRLSTIFGEKIGVFLQNQCYDHFFLKISFFESKTPIF
jgi:hypothetical protein